MPDDDEFHARWHMLQEQYRRLLADWRTYPAPTKEDSGTEARDRGRQLGR